MNEAQQLDNLWQILESRDRVVVRAAQECSGLRQECSGLRQECSVLQQECNGLKAQIEDINKQNCLLVEDNDKLRNALKLHIDLIGELREEIEQLTVKLQLSQTKRESLQHVIEQRDLTIEDIKETLHRSEENRLSLLEKIDQLQEKLNESQGTIEGMESSKFWQLREFFVKIKNSLKLKRED